jgi:hypothetical protein
LDAILSELLDLMEDLSYMRSKCLASLVLALIFLSQVSTAHADGVNYVTNGNFSDGLTGWNSAGVDLHVGTAVLADGDGDSYLFQSVNLGPGTYFLSFDFENNLSSDVLTDENGNAISLFDKFNATLYFSNNELMSSEEFGYLELFSMNAINTEYSPFSITFSMPFNGYKYATPYFDLFDDNSLNDSSVSIGNVSITATTYPVPEPGTLASMAFGIIGLIVAGKKRLIG